MAWTEKSIESANKPSKDDYFNKVLSNYIIFLFTTIGVLINTTKPLLSLIVDAEYYHIWEIIPILYISVGLQALSSFYGSTYISNSKTKNAFYTTFWGATLTVALSYMLIPKYELVGASASIVCGYLLMVLLRGHYSHTFYRTLFPVKKSLLLTIIICASLALNYINNQYFTYVVNPLLSIIVFIVLNKTLLKSRLTKINLHWRLN